MKEGKRLFVQESTHFLLLFIKLPNTPWAPNLGDAAATARGHTRREDGETQQRKGKTQNASLLWPGGWPWAHPGSHERKSVPSHI